MTLKLTEIIRWSWVQPVKKFVPHFSGQKYDHDHSLRSLLYLYSYGFTVRIVVSSLSLIDSSLWIWVQYISKAVRLRIVQSHHHVEPMWPTSGTPQSASAHVPVLPSAQSLWRPAPFRLKNCPFPLGHLQLHLVYASLGQPQSTFQTASRSVQPFLRGSRSWATDRPTYRLITLYSVCSYRPHLATAVMRPINSYVRPDHPHCCNATWICMSSHTYDLTVAYIPRIIKIRSGVLEPRGLKFGPSRCFGCSLLQHLVVLPHKPLKIA